MGKMKKKIITQIYIPLTFFIICCVYFLIHSDSFLKSMFL